jgi:hypothetical protein
VSNAIQDRDWLVNSKSFTYVNTDILLAARAASGEVSLGKESPDTVRCSEENI